VLSNFANQLWFVFSQTCL